ncbi:MAG: uroporphyrinogen decarboxylase family protein [Candidatus Nezhaarchaeales archaeon]
MDGGEEKEMIKEPIDEMRERQKKEPEEVLKERATIFEAAVDLKEPERVPLLLLSCGHLLGKYYKLSEIFFNYDTLKKASLKVIENFPADLFAPVPAADGFIFSVAFADYPDLSPVVRFIAGPIHDILGDKYTRWPGRELSENTTFQFIGGKFMEVEEYDKLIEDPIGFINEVVVPRVCTNLAKPGISRYATYARLGIAGRDFLFNGMIGTSIELTKVGIPPIPLTSAYAPLDVISDFMRYPTNMMLDLRRYPDKVKSATEVLVEPIIKIAMALKPAGAKFAFIPLHLNEMLPPKLYNEFYWPYLKEVIVRLYQNGIRSYILFEGNHMPHLETILELPKGWGLGVFEKGDIKKIRETLKGHTCVAGGIPISLLLQATPDKIDSYVKELLADLAPGGGFILGPGIGEIPAEVPDANLRALVNAALKYGRYKR